MVLRALLGFLILLGAVRLGAWVAGQRAGAPSGTWRRAAGEVHRTTGIVALVLLAVLAITAVRLTR